MSSQQLGCGAMKIERLFDAMDARWLRRVSLLLALATAVIITAWPKILIGEDSHVDHGYVTLLLLANSICFVHGLGYKPSTPIWRYFFTPVLGWPLLLGFWFGLIS